MIVSTESAAREHTQTRFASSFTHLCHKLPANSYVSHGHCFIDKFNFVIFTFLKEIESKCLLFHILFYEQIFSFAIEKILKCKNVTVSRELSVTTLPKRAAIQ